VKWILFVRHLESTKNLEDRFAKKDDSDSLTELGLKNTKDLAVEVWRFVQSLTDRGVMVASSDSPRAVESALALAKLGKLEVFQDKELRSIVVPETEGLSAVEILESDPGAAREYNLYRAGLFSSYELKYTGKYSKVYEASVDRALRKYLKVAADVCVIFAHRSTFTTALIAYARTLGHYPNEFFGFLPIDFGSSTLVEFSGGSVSRIAFANVAYFELNSVGRRLLDG
jgi:broad specificity phosphatase PhoE